ncbi:hypothetical protein [Streptomyces ipomoeae]|uniref:hypothetical protein n=1 Tax=Streptomyces ipomoeae TaxID=103232 RepID=UPI0029A12804|nr:hypothetical protein [Streptomyces ipomoeae]MDX2700572.1 hypothetical protein [Streptomyces ipomoeae]MDX2845418.1 hypothetical protein [Streptomyces ipomoeae]
MANFVFNTALARVGYLAGLPNANDALIAIPLAASGIEADAVLRDKDTFADVVAGATNEQTDLGRQTLTGVTVTVDDTGDQAVIDAADITWPDTTGAAIAAIVICYDPDTTTGTDADLIPLLKYDAAMTPDGTDFTVNVNGLLTITSATA